MRLDIAHVQIRRVFISPYIDRQRIARAARRPKAFQTRVEESDHRENEWSRQGAQTRRSFAVYGLC